MPKITLELGRSQHGPGPHASRSPSELSDMFESTSTEVFALVQAYISSTSHVS